MFCFRCGHTNQDPPPTWRETTISVPKKAATPTNTHPPYEGRQPETTGDKTTSEPKKPTTPTNTKAATSKDALRTPTVNCLGKKVWWTWTCLTGNYADKLSEPPPQIGVSTGMKYDEILHFAERTIKTFRYTAQCQFLVAVCVRTHY